MFRKAPDRAMVKARVKVRVKAVQNVLSCTPGVSCQNATWVEYVEYEEYEENLEGTICMQDGW